MKRLLIVCIITLLLARYATAQEQLTIKQQAARLYERYEYFKSLNLYLKLANKERPDPDVMERIADCYRNMNRYEEAENWYAHVAVDTGVNIIMHYNYAEVLLRDQKFDLAKKQYQFYYKKVKDTGALALKLFSCDSAAAWIKQPSAYLVKGIDNLNSSFSEWGANYYGKDGLVFTSDRRLYSGGTDNRTGNSWFKVYKAGLNGDGATEVPVVSNKTGKYINAYHIGPMALTANADTAYITLTTDVPTDEIVIDKSGKKTSQKLYTRRLQLVIATKRNDQWTILSDFLYNDINHYSIGHAALSTNGRLLYFTSDMPGGEGKTDIWYCEKLTNGTWGKPVNCGKTINTKEEEAFPEIGGNNVLYYSSKGLPGMGGFDIYSAKGTKANWRSPVNLKYPINSTSDDFCLITHDGLSGYLSSNRQGGKGDDDTYTFGYKEPGPVVAQNKAPATVPVIILPITLVTPPSPEPPSPSSSLPKAVQGHEVYGVKNIYYDLDRAYIRPDAVIELNKLVIILKEHPSLLVNVASHTDSRAPDDYNMELSHKRTASVLDYLLKKGIPARRLILESYGETRLINQCADGVKCTEEEQQLNRRTEFTIFEP